MPALRKKIFARDFRCRVEMPDASDGAAQRKIKNKKGRAAARALPRNVSLDASGAHPGRKAGEPVPRRVDHGRSLYRQRPGGNQRRMRVIFAKRRYFRAIDSRPGRTIRIWRTAP